MNSSCKTCQVKKRPPNNVGDFYVEFRKPNTFGYFLSRFHKTFESAQKERERLLEAGATEALIKKKE